MGFFDKLRNKMYKKTKDVTPEDMKKKIRTETGQEDPFERREGKEKQFHERMDKGELSGMKKDIEEHNARIRREQEERRKKKGF